MPVGWDLKVLHCIVIQDRIKCTHSLDVIVAAKTDLAFAGQRVGVAPVSEHIWLVTFVDYDLGYFDDETCRLEPIENPFWRNVLPMCPE